MAESPPPAPPIPRSTVVLDLTMQTPWSLRRNRFYFTTDNAPTGLTDLEKICNAHLGVMAGLLTPIMTTQCKLLRTEGRWYGPGTSGWEANSTTAAFEGEVAAVTPNSTTDETSSTITDTLPDEVCLIIQKRTGNTGRSKYGRWFFSGLTEQFQNAGQIDIEHVPVARGIANALSNDITVSVGFSTILHARHWDKLNNIMVPITKCYAVRAMGTRKDRRQPLRLERA